MLKLNVLIVSLIVMVTLCGCDGADQKRADDLKKIQAMEEDYFGKLQTELSAIWPDWIVKQGVETHVVYERVTDKHRLIVHPTFRDGWFYEIVPLDKMQEVIASPPNFGSYSTAIQSCEARSKQLIEGDK